MAAVDDNGIIDTAKMDVSRDLGNQTVGISGKEANDQMVIEATVSLIVRIGEI